jgi:hypothetical protein
MPRIKYQTEGLPRKGTWRKTVMVIMIIIRIADAYPALTLDRDLKST